jgi:transcriptional regulator with XRE-family HTH domain
MSKSRQVPEEQRPTDEEPLEEQLPDDEPLDEQLLDEEYLDDDALDDVDDDALAFPDDDDEDDGLPLESDSLGNWLRRERLMREISLAEIAEVTRVPRASLEAIEADDYQRLPAPTFVKGFLRAYAGHIGLDPDDVLLRYEERSNPAVERMVEEDDADVLGRAVLTGKVVLVLLLVAVVGFALYLWLTA